MPIHDWTRVTPNTWHDFHLHWISELGNSLNGGVLPPDYYCQAEQQSGEVEPDILTLQATNEADDGNDAESDAEPAGGLALATAPPKTKLTAEVECDHSVRRRRTLVIRHNSNDRIVALLELVSPGNKSSKARLGALVNKAVASLGRGYHLLIVDLFPPGPRDPNGIHGAIWEELDGQVYQQPAGEPLTLVAYAADLVDRAYIEPTAVGSPLIEMPLFLTPDRYVNVPLETTYTAAFQGMPRKYKAILEA